jgi:translation initiation factor 1
VVFGEAEANPVITDPFAEADEDTGETKQSQNYIHIRIQRAYPHRLYRFDIPASSLWGPTLTLPDPEIERNGRKTLTTVQGLPKKFDQKKILKVIKKKFGKFLQQ